jgi:Fic family protein
MNTIQQLYNEWQSLQPLKPEDQKRLDQKFMLEFNYNSNHIEGNTLTYGQTKLLFMFGETTGNASLRDYEEMKAHNVGLEMMKREANDKERPLSETFIRELNSTILVENFWKNAKTPTGETTRMEVQVGVYKTRQNSVITATGEIFEYASPQETPAFMTDLVSWYNEEERKGDLSPIELAALLHYRYIRIHPFEDGNGRIARLLVNYVLHRHGYPMIIVRSDKEHKDEYLRILHQCDVEVGLSPSDGAHASMEKIQPFVAYMETQLQRALEISIKAAKGESIEEEDDFTKRITLLEREAKQQHDNKKQKVQTKADTAADVIEYFYLPLRNKMLNSLKYASNTFYQQEWDETSFSKEKERKGASKIDKIEDWIKGLSDVKKIETLSNIKTIFYNYILRYPKEAYEVLPTVLNVGFSIALEEEYYTVSSLDNKQFKYGNYPSNEEVERIVSMYKTDVLNKIEKAIHDANK